MNKERFRLLSSAEELHALVGSYRSPAYEYVGQPAIPAATAHIYELGSLFGCRVFFFPDDCLALETVTLLNVLLQHPLTATSHTTEALALRQSIFAFVLLILCFQLIYGRVHDSFSS